MFKNRALLLAKIEAEYGVDPAPAQAANAILCDLPEIDPVMKKLDRPNVKAFLGNRPVLNVGESVKITFNTEIKGSGDAVPDTPPEIGVLLRGCGMLETVDMAAAAVDLTFSQSAKTVTRASGSFVADGFEAGDVITTNAALNPGPFTVTDVAALVLTVAEAVADEGPVEKVVTAKRVTYTPQDDIDGPSITIWTWVHNILHKITGCRGTCTVEGKAGEFGKIAWEFEGLWQGPTDDEIPTDAVFNATAPPILKSGAFSLGAWEGTIENYKLSLGNEIVKRPDVNAPTGVLSYFIKDRNATAEVDPEVPDLGTFDPFAALIAGTEMAMSITFGSSAGNRMKVRTPKVVLDGVKYGERENILTYALPLVVCPLAGEDDVAVIFN
jgi:hypothetical protein